MIKALFFKVFLGGKTEYYSLLFSISHYISI